MHSECVMNKVKNILLAGVGGQGILLASEILSEALMLAGYDVKKAEVHGMAQRGGNVVSHVRYGDKVFSPTIPDGEVDILFGFELLETARNIDQLGSEGVVIVNTLKLAPPSVSIGKTAYPSGLVEKIQEKVPNAKIIDGMDLAQKAGDLRTVNIVLLGALSTTMDLDETIWQQAMEKMIPERLLEVNRAAFALGQSA